MPWPGHVKIVLDTNILISAVITPGGLSDELYQAWMDGVFTLITSNDQIAEVKRVVTYEHLQRFIKPYQANRLLETISSEAQIVECLPEVDLSPDPDDNAILATALAGGADLIVTGDKRDLLSLKQIDAAVGSSRVISIITAREAIERLGKTD